MSIKNLVLFLCFTSYVSCTTTRSFSIEEINQHKAEILTFQKEHNHHFADSSSSPLTETDRATFTSLDYFPIDIGYKVTGKFKATQDAKPFQIATSSGKEKIFVKKGIFVFSLKGKKHKLSLYQSIRSAKMGLTDYFLPFTDLTNGESTYGGGRYLDIPPPKGNIMILDFNRTYNPYCAYSDGWSCPIPPSENVLSVAIEAGVKAFEKE